MRPLTPLSSRCSPDSANPLILRASPESGDIADHFSGNPTAKLVLVEYADYECPGCKNSDPYLKEIAKDYEDSIAFIYRNFPLSFHPNAKAAAVIAEAASLQGKFWEMNEALFENQSAWSGASSVDLRDSIFTYIAEEAGLNMAKLKVDAANPNMSKKVDFDYNLGREQKVNETPSLYLNNEKINSETWGDEQKFRTLLDAKIAELAITN